jgi:hypothetical protein
VPCSGLPPLCGRYEATARWVAYLPAGNLKCGDTQVEPPHRNPGRFSHPAESLVPDTSRFSVMVSGLMLACWAWSGVSLAVAFCIAIMLGIAIALGVTVALCVAVPTCVLGRRALWSGLALWSRGAADRQ